MLPHPILASTKLYLFSTVNIFSAFSWQVLDQKTFLLYVTGKPFAFASSFVNDDGRKYEPKYVIDKTTGGNLQEMFKSAKERYPWLAIEFGSKITVDKVKSSVLYVSSIVCI